jgi:L-aminopeptidase/D-esterase-like protein
VTTDAGLRADSLAIFDSVTVGHWTDAVARTGCTVIVFEHPCRCVADVRGGAPGTRETDLLAAGRLVQRADAILLTGGSAFGLAAADGVMQGLHEDGRGFALGDATTTVPIVPAAVLFDLAVGQSVWPATDSGLAAYRARGPLSGMERGQVGAGTGATTAKILGEAGARRGGIGLGSALWNEGGVAAVAAVNALGVVSSEPVKEDPRPVLLRQLGEMSSAHSTVPPSSSSAANTTLVVVLVAAPTNRDALQRVAVAAHDAMAHAVVPSHTIFDGDVVFAAGLEDGSPTPEDNLLLAIATELAVEAAIRDAVHS